MPDPTTIADSAPSLPHIQWVEAGLTQSALWRSERGAAPPPRVVLADDTLSADAAYRLACAGTALLWRGDFQNARQLLQALARRIDKIPARKKRPAAKTAAGTPVTTDPATQFHLHRQAQAQRARILGMVLLPFNADFSIPLGRAPDARTACTEAWGPPIPGQGASVATLRDLLGIISAHEWRKKGVEIAALGAAPHNRVFPHYGVFSPLRGEYIELVAQAPLPVAEADRQAMVAFDIGTGTGVLAAVLARRQVGQVVATDMDARALECARANLAQLGVAAQVQVQVADLFPPGRADVIVCNPPWLPARPSSPVEYAVYDENSRMLLGFLAGLAAHLTPRGEGWLIVSDFAEHLGLRSRAELLSAIDQAGLTVLGRLETKPQHPKTRDASDALHFARVAEVTSLWRLGAVTTTTQPLF